MSVRLYANHSHKKCDYFEHNKLNKHLADDNCLSVGKIGSFSEKKQKLNYNLKQWKYMRFWNNTNLFPLCGFISIVVVADYPNNRFETNRKIQKI